MGVRKSWSSVWARGEFDLVEVFEGVAQVDEHEVAFVAEQRIEDGLLFCFGAGDGGDFSEGGGGDALLFGGGEGTPSLPVEGEELVKHAGAFDGERYCWSFRHGYGLRDSLDEGAGNREQGRGGVRGMGVYT